MITFITNVDIKTRLTFCFVLIIALMSVGTGILLWQSHVMRTQANRLKEMDEQFMEVQRVRSLVLSFRNESEQVVRARNLARLQQEAPALRNQLNDSLRRTQTVFRGIEPNNILDPSVLPTLETIQGVLPSQLDSLTTLASVGDWEALRQRVEQPLDVLSSLSAELVDAASGDLQNKRSEAARQIERAQIRTLFILTAVGVLTIVIAALLGFGITQTITRPLRSLVDAASALASGEFSHHVPVQGRDELAHLSRVFNQTTIKLQQLYENLQRSEQELRDVINAVPALIWRASPDGEVDFINERLQQFIGIPPEDLRGWNLQSVLHPDDRARFVAEWRAAVKDGRQNEDEVRVRRADGKYCWFLIRNVPLRNEVGNIVKWYGTGIEIEDRKRAEEERQRLNQLKAELAHINRVSTLGELAASISHELKQPICAAVTCAQASLRWLNRDQPDLDEARRATAESVKDGVRAANIIDRLGSLFKKTPPQRESVDVDEIIGEMVLLLRGEANRYAISIRTDHAADLPKVTADRVQLQQVLMNLMLNGIEAMKETGGVLTVKTGPGEGGQVLISVSDTGVGLPAGRADEIFNAFFTTKPQGTGMGLPISRSIVESHGGRLWATSHDGRGATFHFTLPTAVVEVSAPI
ncbi:sensor histidine kinase [Edaphobacter aggregans]|uniref:sensor histidine kinase n=1 Tax=Edaphobacter aggregans TaxID=570835 RepID=UPI00147041DD|nr:ATP-binding protein [Edaphobacter aggregans]